MDSGGNPVNRQWTPEAIREMVLGLDAPVRLQNQRLVPAINLDNAATTPPFKRAAEEIHRQLLYYGSIGRGKGQKSEHSSTVYANGRDAVKAFFGASDDRYTVFYAGSTTDGMNKLASALITSHRDIVLTTRMEHHANDLPWRERARVVYAEVGCDGRLIEDDFERLLSKYNGKIKVVTVTAASNVTGYVNDVHAIARAAHRHGALMVVDGAQIASHRAFSMLGGTPEENIDFFVFSAHKMYSPYGGGAVIGLEDVLNRHIPVFYGGGMVEEVTDDDVTYTDAPDLYEAGSPNYPGVVGMVKAMETLLSIGFDYVRAHEQRLLRAAITGLSGIPGVVLYGDCENIADRVGIVVFNIEGVDSGDVADMLAGEAAIAVRHAKFCAHTYVRRLLDASGACAACQTAAGMVRASFGIYNTEEDVRALVRTIARFARGEKTALFSRDESKQIKLPRDRG